MHLNGGDKEVVQSSFLVPVEGHGLVEQAVGHLLLVASADTHQEYVRSGAYELLWAMLQHQHATCRSR